MIAIATLYMVNFMGTMRENRVTTDQGNQGKIPVGEKSGNLVWAGKARE